MRKIPEILTESGVAVVKIIVACASGAQCAQFSGALESAGLSVFCCCGTLGEVRRALNRCGDAVVVSAVRFPDGMLDELAADIDPKLPVLAVGKPEQLALCEHEGLFRLPAPFSRGELTSAVSMLLQMAHMRMPKRSQEDQQLVNAAKALLMESRGMSESDAHRFLQRGAMDRCLKMRDFAAQLLNESGHISVE